MDCISIIVPVYNAAAYLPGCLDSILAQTYENLEIILVDDGSRDASGAICDAYGEKNPRIRVIHKTNGGASSARNAGLDAATGRFISFVDSDDLLPSDAMAALAAAVVDSGCDYAAGMCGILGSDRVKYPISSRRVIRGREEPMAVLDYLCTPGSYSPYAKILRRSAIGALRFNEFHKCSEDSLFIRQFMAACNGICLVPSLVYHYNTGNENSLSKKFYADYCLYFGDKLRALEALADTLGVPEEQKRRFLAERAIHGLRISLRHYFGHAAGKEMQQASAEMCLNQFLPWIGEGTDSFRDPSLAKWWKRNRKPALSGDVSTLCRLQRQTEALRMAKNALKKLLRK